MLSTSRVAEFNDADGLERELAHGDVAAVLMEPALTNIGIVLPEPGYLEAVREITRRHGVLLINDETHTFSAGPGGATGHWGLTPDMVTIGKAIAGGIPCGAYGLSAALAERALGRPDLDLVDMGGVGGTLAGNPVSMAAARACLGAVLTDEAFEHMTALTTGWPPRCAPRSPRPACPGRCPSSARGSSSASPTRLPAPAPSPTPPPTPSSTTTCTCSRPTGACC